jgi:Tol biopolymer transport system component/DNA-binding winged helix-turn-helix (wHTH) protein
LALLENPGELVTREELRRRLWPSDTFVDFDHSLNTAMMKLRDALGDSTDAPIYIETVPRRGYRFIAPVLAASAPLSAAAAQPESPASVAEPLVAPQFTSSLTDGVARRFLWLTTITLGCLLVIVMGGGAYLWFDHWRPANFASEPTNYQIVPVVSAPGITLAPSLSPDGRMVAYIWDGPERRYELYVKLIGAELPRRITYESGRMGNPAWSPDGRDIAFTRCDLTKGEGFVILVPALGGPERRITEAGCPYNLPSSLAWSPVDGGRLIFIDHCAADRPLGLISFSLTTGQRQCLADAIPPGFERRFVFSLSPDGTRVAFIPSTDAACEIHSLPVAGGTASQIFRDNDRCLTLMWTPDGRAIVFSSLRTTLNSLWRVSVPGGKLRKEDLYPAIGRFSADGRRFVYEEGTYAEPPSIWRADLAGPGGKILSNRKLISTQTSDLDAQPSPDGTRIAWMSQRTGPHEIWISNANGDRPRQLTHLNAFAGTPRWSPDGKWIAFDFDRGSAQIFVIDTEGRNLRQVTLGLGYNVVPSWSRDGKWIYFASERSGSKQVWKHSVETGKELQVTTHGGFNAFESLDGRSIYFSKWDEAGIWNIPSEGGTESLVIEGKPQTLYWGQWALTTAGIYFMNVEAEPRAHIDFYDFATRRAHTVLALDMLPAWAQPSLSSTADGVTIYYAQQGYQSGARMMDFQQ